VRTVSSCQRVNTPGLRKQQTVHPFAGVPGVVLRHLLVQQLPGGGIAVAEAEISVSIVLLACCALLPARPSL